MRKIFTEALSPRRASGMCRCISPDETVYYLQMRSLRYFHTCENSNWNINVIKKHKKLQNESLWVSMIWNNSSSHEPSSLKKLMISNKRNFSGNTLSSLRYFSRKFGGELSQAYVIKKGGRAARGWLTNDLQRGGDGVKKSESRQK